MAATPPDGYAVPKVITDLVDHATAHGWAAAVQRYAPEPGAASEPFTTVQVGRRAVESDYTGFRRGPHWLYRLTWHARGCEAGRVRKFGAGLAQTPNRPQWHDAPSVKKIREVIAANPAPKYTP
ncbi:hypothetical protein [Streptomyces venezuelae]|uniref:hypothetical protein n=1 Tax=Streptomyces venezuelae TaxID=54571 RepID=UPI0034261B86